MAAHKPTDEQQAIIRAARSSAASLQISAYAGTGKTSTLEMLAPALGNVRGAAFAFNKAIATELSARFPPNFKVQTLNALGHQALAKGLPSLKLDAKKLINLGKKMGLPYGSEAEDIRELVGLAMTKGIVPSGFDTVKGLTPDTTDEWQKLGDTPPTLEGVAKAREMLIFSIKEALRGNINFDDQIYIPVFFTPQFLPRFDCVLVDEAQDLSPLNHKQLEICAKGRVIAVGDRRQAIYAWRGADAKSMDNIRLLRDEWLDLPLTTTFRCPQTIVKRQQAHAPGYNAAPTNPEGTYERFSAWSWGEVEDLRAASKLNGKCAVLCRNNAPLVALTLKLLAQHIPAHMLGRDVAAGLAKLSRKLAPQNSTGQQELQRLIAQWKETEVTKALANEDERAETIMDKADALSAIASTVRDAGELRQVLESIFAENGTQGIILSSVHKAKGREWDCVVHLDPWRMPSRYARTPQAQEQEANLHYVCETRTKHTLIEASLNEFGAGG